jgi:hypothetical protein
MASSRTRRGNRLGLGLVGTVLVVGGAAAVARGDGLFGAAGLDTNPGSANTPLLSSSETRYIHQAGWFWPAVAAVAIVVALLCLRWLIVQTRVERTGDLQLEPDRTHGGTIIDTGALVDTVEDEIAAYAGVARARGRLVGDLTHPQLHLVVDLHEGADPAHIRERISEGALRNLRQALELDALPARITLRVDASRRRQRAA